MPLNVSQTFLPTTNIQICQFIVAVLIQTTAGNVCLKAGVGGGGLCLWKAVKGIRFSGTVVIDSFEPPELVLENLPCSLESMKCFSFSLKKIFI